tara:strand:+ start:2746 stop:2988 length:243 start_codon:yes stop_codon:yes gene_type:complete
MEPSIKATRAQQILNDEVFTEALSVLKKDSIGVFLYPTATDEEIMEARKAVLALSLVERQLQRFVDDWKLLERKLKGSGP